MRSQILNLQVLVNVLAHVTDGRCNQTGIVGSPARLFVNVGGY